MPSKPRLVFFAPHFVELSTRLVEALARDHEVLFVVDSNAIARELDRDWFRRTTAGVRVLSFRADRRYWRWVWPTLIKLKILLFRPHMAHMQEQADDPTAQVARFLARRYPLVVTVHDPTPHMGNDAEFLRRGAQQFRDQIRALAHAFHVHSRLAAREMAELYGDRPIIPTEHGVIHAPRPDQIRTPEAGRILFFGRMEAYKGLRVLMDAADRLNALGRGYNLVLAGRGESLTQLSDRIRATPGVTVLDRFIQPDEVVDEFQKCALAVLPYLEATQSGVAAAAIANGRPVVASSTGGLPELIQSGKNGLLVEPGDAEQLADAMDRILSDDALLKTLTAGAAATQASLGWDRVADILTRAYRDLRSRTLKSAGR